MSEPLDNNPNDPNNWTPEEYIAHTNYKLGLARAEIERLRGLLRQFIKGSVGYVGMGGSFDRGCHFCEYEWEHGTEESHGADCPVALGKAALAEKP